MSARLYLVEVGVMVMVVATSKREAERFVACDRDGCLRDAMEHDAPAASEATMEGLEEGMADSPPWLACAVVDEATSRTCAEWLAGTG